MLKGKVKGKWEELNDIEYIDIPKPIQDLAGTNFKTVEIREHSPFFLIALVFLLFVGWLISTLKYQYLQSWNILLGSSILVALIYLISRNFIKKSYLTISLKGISYRNGAIGWSEISNMYVRQEYTGEDHSFELVIEKNDNTVKSIGLKWLSKKPNIIISLIGKYYWEWSRTH